MPWTSNSILPSIKFSNFETQAIFCVGESIFSDIVRFYKSICPFTIEKRLAWAKRFPQKIFFLYISNWLTESSFWYRLINALKIYFIQLKYRYGAVVHPYHYRIWVTTGKVQMISFLAVVFTGFHSALPLMGMGRMKAYYHRAYSHFDMSRWADTWSL